MNAREYDVIVVGAGLAGLSAASQLTLADQRVLVLEATAQVGGRVVVSRMSNIAFALGGQVVHTLHAQLLELLLDNEAIESTDLPKSIQTFTKANLLSSIGEQPYWKRRDLIKAVQKIDEDLVEFDVAKPWSHPSASALDHMTFADYLQRITSSRFAFTFLRKYFCNALGYDVAGLSALDVLHHLKCDLWNLNVSSSEYPAMLPCNAMQKLFSNFSRDLEIKYRHPVHEVEQFRNGVKVAGAFFEFDCRHLILATPIPALRSIKIKPHFPKSRRKLWNQVFSTEAFRMASLFDELQSHQILPASPPFRTLELKPVREGQSLLVGEAWGEDAVQLSQMKVKEREVIWDEMIAKSLRSVGKPVVTTVKFWNDDFWHSGVRLFRPLGSWTIDRDLLSKSNGRIHFAGSETTVSHFGTMEGAVKSGYRAANQILSKSRSYHEF